MIDLGAWAAEKYKVAAPEGKNDDKSGQQKQRR